MDGRELHQDVELLTPHYRGAHAAQIDRHTEAVDELDVQGILGFAERILPRASELVSRISASWNQLERWLKAGDSLRSAA